MKKRHIGVLILLIILAFAAGYLWQVTHRLGELKYSIQKMTLGSEKEKFTMEAEYPVIESGIPEKVKNTINTELEKSVRSSIENSKLDFDDLLTDPFISSSELNLTYISKVKIENDFEQLPFINISFETYYYSGGAHGITAIETFVYNALTGEKMSLDKVLAGDYLNKLSELSLMEIKKIDPKLETYNFAEDGTKPIAENFQTWTLEPDGMHIIFSDYQVGPYVVGRPETVIPYEKFGELLSLEIKNY